MPTVRTACALCAGMLLMPLAANAQSSTVEREFPEGDFAITISRDALTDANTSHAMSIAENEEGALAWKCMEDGLNVVLAIGNPYEGDEDDDIMVQYRFDSEEPAPQEYWALFGGKKMAYIRMDMVSTFTDAAMKAERVAVRAVDPYDDESRTFLFGLDGLDKALKHLPCAGEVE